MPETEDLDGQLKELSGYIDRWQNRSSSGADADSTELVHINELMVSLNSKSSSFSSTQRNEYETMKLLYNELYESIYEKSLQNGGPVLSKYISDPTFSKAHEKKEIPIAVQIETQLKILAAQLDKWKTQQDGLTTDLPNLGQIDKLLDSLDSKSSSFSDAQRNEYETMKFLHGELQSNSANTTNLLIEPKRASSSLTNCREIKPTVGGRSIKIVGLAHPRRYHDNLDSTISAIAARATTLISLDNEFQDIKQSFIKHNKHSHYDIVIEDFHAPTIEQYEKLYAIVSEKAKLGETVAIHCGEGYGRTGTMLASIQLQASLEKKFLDDPASFQNYSFDTKDTIYLGHFSNVPQMQCTHGVYEAIASVREATIEPSPKNTHGDSVENLAQVESLMLLERHLVEKFKKRYGEEVVSALSGAKPPKTLPPRSLNSIATSKNLISGQVPQNGIQKELRKRSFSGSLLFRRLWGLLAGAQRKEIASDLKDLSVLLSELKGPVDDNTGIKEQRRDELMVKIEKNLSTLTNNEKFNSNYMTLLNDNGLAPKSSNEGGHRDFKH